MRRVVVLGAFPPPLHGSSIITEEIYNFLKNVYLVSKVNSSLSTSNKDIGRVKFLKFARIIKLCFRCLLNRDQNIIYWCPAPNGPAFLKDYILFTLLKLFSKSKVIVHIHARGFEIDSSFALLLKARVLRDSKVFCVSEDMKNTLIPHFSSNFHCVWNPVLLKPNLNEVSRDVDLLFVSNMFKEKGPLEFIEVVRIVKEQYPGIKAAMVGAEADISYVHIKNIISQYHLDDNIKIMGPMKHSELSEIYAKSRLFIFPSVYKKESFGLVVAEAMSFGTPSIIYNKWGVRNLIVDGENGYKCKVHDKEAIALHAIRLLGASDEWARMSNRSKSIARERFSLKNYIKAILSLIDEIE